MAWEIEEHWKDLRVWFRARKADGVGVAEVELFSVLPDDSQHAVMFLKRSPCVRWERTTFPDEAVRLIAGTVDADGASLTFAEGAPVGFGTLDDIADLGQAIKRVYERGGELVAETAGVAPG